MPCTNRLVSVKIRAVTNFGSGACRETASGRRGQRRSRPCRVAAAPGQRRADQAGVGSSGSRPRRIVTRSPVTWTSSVVIARIRVSGWPKIDTRHPATRSRRSRPSSCRSRRIVTSRSSPPRAARTASRSPPGRNGCPPSSTSARRRSRPSSCRSRRIVTSRSSPPRPARTAARITTRRTVAVHRARPLRRREARAPSGPHDADQHSASRTAATATARPWRASAMPSFDVTELAARHAQAHAAVRPSADRRRRRGLNTEPGTVGRSGRVLLDDLVEAVGADRNRRTGRPLRAARRSCSHRRWRGARQLSRRRIRSRSPHRGSRRCGAC